MEENDDDDARTRRADTKAIQISCFSVISMSLSTFFDRSRFLYTTTCILIDALRECERGGRSKNIHSNLSDPVFSLARTLRHISTSMSKVTGIKGKGPAAQVPSQVTTESPKKALNTIVLVLGLFCCGGIGTTTTAEDVQCDVRTRNGFLT